MKRRTKLMSFAVFFVAVLSAATWALFRGYFDRGNYEVKQVVWSPDKTRVAIVAERSDNQSLGGLEYFVVVSDHQLSLKELRLALHSDEPVFNAEAPCLAVKWRSPKELELSCNNASDTIDSHHINSMKQDSDGIRIMYKDIPLD